LFNIIDLRKKPLQKTSRRARGGAEKGALLLNFASPTILFLVSIMKINMKNESGFLIIYNLCVKKFKRIPLKIMMVSSVL